jgi:PAS domain S-box-containing protein
MSPAFDEERFRALIEHSLDAIALVELDGTVSYVSPSIVRVLGYTPEEFVGLDAFQAVHHDDRDSARQKFADLMRTPGGSQMVLNRVRHKDGSWRWIETVATNQLENPRLRAVVANFRDVTDRRRIEEALREREEHFRLIVESATDFAIFTLTLDGRIVSWNSGAERTLGYSEEEILGKHVSIIFTPEDIAGGRVAFEMRGALYQGHENDDRWHVRKGGVRFWANGIMMPLRDDAGVVKGYLKILRDRTEQKLARDALKLSEDRFRIALDAARLGLWHCELPQRTLVWDDQCKKHFGLPADAQVTLDTFYELVHPEDRERTCEAVERTIAEHTPFDYEYRVVAPDGRVRWIQAIGRGFHDDSGQPCRFDGVTIDVTDRKEAEEALRESEKRFRSMADTAPVLIWMANTDGDPSYFNAPWLELTGRPMEQELGDGWAEGVHPEDRARCLSTYRAAFAARRAYDIEYRLRRHDGEYRWIFVKAGPLFTPGGEFTGFIGSGIDITDRKRAEQALKDADRRKDEFLAMLAHELRNPLAAINNAVQLSLRPAADEDLVWSKEVIDRQAKHLARLIDDLLDVSRITRGKIRLRKERLDLAPIVVGAVEAVRPLIESKKHQLTLSIAPAQMRLLADATRMEQVLVNILTNAAKYTEPCGHIMLSAHHDGKVILRVKDTGVGIASDLLPHIFDLFTQADRSIDRSQGGLGIGLTLVKRLVEMHGGTVAARSDGPGKGSEFTIELPTVADDVEERAAPRPESRPWEHAPTALHVLVVDDNLDTATGMTKLLGASGYRVTTAHDGPTALDVARAERPDVILIDIGLPGMDGYRVTQELRKDECCKEAVIIAISGYGQEQDRRRSRQAGIDHHLVKPVDYDDLLALLARQKSIFPFAPDPLRGP